MKYLLVVALLAAQAVCAKPFADGDRVVFFGDSITHGGAYHEYIALYYATRFPKADIWFSNSGWSGASLTNGFRMLQCDVVDKKPTHVTLMFGMNDVNRGAWPRSVASANQIVGRHNALATYEERFINLAKLIRERANNPQLIYLTPSPYDQTCIDKGKESDCICNDGLAMMAEFVRYRAAMDKVLCVDLQRDICALNAIGQAKDPSFSVLRADDGKGLDRIHPRAFGHTLFAYSFLMAQGCPAEVDTIVRDAKGAARLEFTCTEKALPMPLTKRMKEGAALVPFAQNLNTELLRVTNLASGNYAVKIDGKEVARATAAELAKGLNLADNEATPMYQQAAAAAQINSRVWTLQRDVRNFVTRREWTRWYYKTDPDDAAAMKKLFDEVISKKPDSYDYHTYKQYAAKWPHHEKIYADLESARAELRKAVQPKPHKFTIEQL